MNAFGADSTFCGMKRFMILLVALSTAVCGCAGSNSERKAPRKVAVQTWTFHNHTLTDTVNMLKDTPVRALQCYPGQKLGGKFGKNAAFGHWMTPEQKAYVKGLMSSNGFKIIGYGVTGAKDEKGIRAVCEFAKEFSIPAIATESPKSLLPLWDKICGEYGIKMVIHCHQKGSGNDYYNPKVVMELIKDAKNVGVCADNGAWGCSGIDNVQGFKDVKDKLVEIHFKDLREFGKLDSPTVAYGEGVLPLKEMLAELDRQGYDGYFIIEDGSASDPLLNVKKDVEFLKNN